MRNIKAVFIKQVLSYIKNPAMYGTPITFLLLPLAFRIFIPEIQPELIVTQFLVMFVGISMIGASAGFLAEDRVTMNLRFMGMSGVKPYQYLIGTCGTLLVVSFIAITLFGLIGQHSGQALINFITVSMLGAASSMLLGITLGLSKFADFTMIIALLLGVGPVFADANETLEQIFYFTYTMQVNNAVQGYLNVNPIGSIQIILINMTVLLIAFIVMNMKNGLDGEKIVKKMA